MAKVKKVVLILMTAVVAVCLGRCLYASRQTSFSVRADDGFALADSEATLLQALSGSQNIRLTSNVNTSTALNVTRALTVDLNGYTLKYQGTDTSPVITVGEAGSLTLSDSNTTATHYYTSQNNLYTFAENLTENNSQGFISGGLITGGTDYGIKVNSGGALTVQGGVIAGNAGGIVANGDVVVTGGKISYNNSAGGAGGVYVDADGSLQISGSVVIDENYQGESKSNVLLSTGKNVQVVGALTSGASVSITATELAKSPVVTSGGIQASDVISYLKTDSIDKTHMTAYRQIVSGNTIVWKLVTLVDKPADEEVTYNGQNQTPAAISSINGELVTAAAQSTTFKNASTYPITLTLDADDALWSDGDTSLTYTFDFIIDKKLIATPDVSQTSFTYSGEEIKLDIAESDYYTIEDAAKTEAGEYTAKLTLTDPENTAWADTTAITLGINFKILISDEMSLLWLVLLLAAILIEELVVSNIYWHKRSRVHVENVQTSTGDEELDEQSRITEDDIKGYTEGYDDNDDNNNNINNINNNAFSVAPFGLVLLAVHAPTWQIVAISLLSAAIILVAACNIVHAIRQNRIEAEEHNYEGLVPDGADRRHYDSVSPSSDTFITFVPPMPSPYEDENIRVPDGSDFTARKIIVNGCGDIPNPNPAMRNGTVITYNNSQTDTGSKPDEIMSADDEEVDAAELPADVKPVEERIAVRDENGEVAEVLRGIDYNTDTAYVIRYKKSFTARLIQAWDDSKDYYTELKNEALSYEGAKSRVSWDYDCISINLIPVIKFDIRGKTLCMYTPLKPEDYSGSRFEVERSKVKKCEDVPCLYRIKNRTCVNYAKELIAVAMLRFNAKQGNIIRKNYSKPYESIQTLVEMELAKEYLAKEKYSEFLKKSEKVGEAEKLNNTSDAEETKPLIDMDEEDIEEVRVVDKATGEEVIKRYNKSFTAKLIQASDETKSFYTTLKNEILSYNKTRSTIWWNCDSIHTSNKTIARFGIQDGVLCLYVALKPSDYTNLYPVEKAVGKRYAHVPCMFRIKNNKRCNDALRLIDTLAQKCGLERGTQKTEDYFRPFDTTENLLDMGLIKEVGSKENSEEKKRLSRKTVEDKRKVKVSCQDVNKIIDDDTAIILVENKRSGKNYSGKKQEIGIDAISSAYAAGEVVNIESLKQKGLIPQDVGYIKILARGELDKPLTVEANDFSIGAVKMIILTGGTARKV